MYPTYFLQSSAEYRVVQDRAEGISAKHDHGLGRRFIPASFLSCHQCLVVFTVYTVLISI